MNIKKIALASAALALLACETQSSTTGSKVEPKKPAAITATSSLDQKFAYMLGFQFATPSLVNVPVQMGEEINLDAVIQGVRDNEKSVKDTAFKLPVSMDSLRAVNDRFYAVARERVEKSRPDSATLASFNGDYSKANAYVDSAIHALPVNPADPAKGDIKLTMSSSDNLKLSYILGLQFDSQLNAVGSRVDASLDEDYFILGIREAAAKLKDSNFVLQLPQDSMVAIDQIYKKKAEEKMNEARKKFEEEQNKLKAEVASLKGDTLANGMPKKFNFSVKVTGITNKDQDLGAYEGKSMLTFYFSSTCGHCQHAAPQILEMAKEFAPKGLTILAVASGGNNKSGIRKFMDNAKWSETNVMNVVWDESRQFGELYSDGYVPKVYLVNPDGTYKLYGSFEAEKDMLKQDIAALLNGTPVVWNPEPPKVEEAPAAAPAPVAAPAAAPKAPAPAKKAKK